MSNLIFQTGTIGVLKRTVIAEKWGSDTVLTALPQGTKVEVLSIMPPKLSALTPGSDYPVTYIINEPRRWGEVIDVIHNPPIGKILC